ncbi:MAG TPA: hypothetical protein VMU41_19465 [Candidatus Binataceae bacterium]|nr:hypothetical protein [Candidatus Binataceae bacterium]
MSAELVPHYTRYARHLLAHYEAVQIATTDAREVDFQLYIG